MTAMAATPAVEAHGRAEAFGPYIATYLKKSTQEPVLEIHYRGDGDATARATSPDGVFMVSVDRSHIRIRTDDSTCAQVDALSLVMEVQALRMGTPPATPTPRLFYRSTPEGSIDMGTAFLGIPSPVLFSWHADLDLDDVEVSPTKKAWVAKSKTSSWSVSRKTGLLQSLSVGDDELVLDTVESGKKVEPAKAADICPVSTAPALERQLSLQIRIESFPEVFAEAAAAWEGMDEEQREAAVTRYQAWWEGFLADDLPSWEQGLAQAPWRAELLLKVADRPAFDAFSAELAADERPDAVGRWKQLWFNAIGQQMLADHGEEILRKLRPGLQALPEHHPEPEQVLLVGALKQALLASGEDLIKRLVIPVLDEGSAGLSP